MLSRTSDEGDLVIGEASRVCLWGDRDPGARPRTRASTAIPVSGFKAEGPGECPGYTVSPSFCVEALTPVGPGGR